MHTVNHCIGLIGNR